MWGNDNSYLEHKNSGGVYLEVTNLTKSTSLKKMIRRKWKKNRIKIQLVQCDLGKVKFTG